MCVAFPSDKHPYLSMACSSAALFLALHPFLYQLAVTLCLESARFWNPHWRVRPCWRVFELEDQLNGSYNLESGLTLFSCWVSRCQASLMAKATGRQGRPFLPWEIFAHPIPIDRDVCRHPPMGEPLRLYHNFLLVCWAHFSMVPFQALYASSTTRLWNPSFLLSIALFIKTTFSLACISSKAKVTLCDSEPWLLKLAHFGRGNLRWKITSLRLTWGPVYGASY